MRNFSIIVAATQKENGIGFANAIPWHLRTDLDEFKRITLDAKEGMQNAVIMGRKTWESIPVKFRPLKGRVNIILTRSKVSEETKYSKNILFASSWKHAFQLLSPNVEKVFVAGGASLYTEALLSPFCETIYVTCIFQNFKCDTFLPQIDTARFRIQQTSSIQKEGDIDFQFIKYVRQHEEYQYLDLISECIFAGQHKPNRTEFDTLSHFGRQMRFNLRNGSFPLLTTKTVFGAVLWKNFFG